MAVMHAIMAPVRRVAAAAGAVVFRMFMAVRSAFMSVPHGPNIIPIYRKSRYIAIYPDSPIAQAKSVDFAARMADTFGHAYSLCHRHRPQRLPPTRLAAWCH
jgi:hypothetical protein